MSEFKSLRTLRNDVYRFAESKGFEIDFGGIGCRLLILNGDEVGTIQHHPRSKKQRYTIYVEKHINLLDNI